MSSTYLRLFSNCIPVKGFKRSVIINLWKHEYHFIPNLLYEKITKQWIKIPFETIQKSEIDNEYIDFLLKNNLAYLFNSEEIKNFPKLNLEWDSPAKITNAIIDVKLLNMNDIKSFIAQVYKLGCNFIQLRFYNNLDIENIENIVLFAKNEGIISIQIIIPFLNEKFTQEIIGLCNIYPNIDYIIQFA